MSDIEPGDRDFEEYINNTGGGSYERQIDFFMLLGIREKNRFIAEMHKQTIEAMKVAKDHDWSEEVKDALQAFLGKIMDTTEKTLDQLDLLLMSQIPDAPDYPDDLEEKEL